ncbi:MAG: hypothetical protein IPM15_07860 [Betaproteobacteria bacterium]|nr:hypothetical protein [Betaproteobacteria bacterium]MCC6246821.1 hypothetical protein [Rubrivivax sp.]MCL4698651.1 hypothetical protein [Burkholderiaceae bacterium]NUP88006.1 hypothetical protein [Burkholderiaceae bacterium]
MDTVHHHLVHNSGVPGAWPGFCASFDVTAAALVALITLARARSDRVDGLGPDLPGEPT